METEEDDGMVKFRQTGAGGGTIESVVGIAGIQLLSGMMPPVKQLHVIDHGVIKSKYYVIKVSATYLCKRTGHNVWAQLRPGDMIWWETDGKAYWNPVGAMSPDAREEVKSGYKKIELKIFGDIREIV